MKKITVHPIISYGIVFATSAVGGKHQQRRARIGGFKILVGEEPAIDL